MQVFAETSDRAQLWPASSSAEQTGPHKAYLEDRLKAGMWNAQVLIREIRQRGYA